MIVMIDCMLPLFVVGATQALVLDSNWMCLDSHIWPRPPLRRARSGTLWVAAAPPHPARQHGRAPCPPTRRSAPLCRTSTTARGGTARSGLGREEPPTAHCPRSTPPATRGAPARAQAHGRRALASAWSAAEQHAPSCRSSLGCWAPGALESRRRAYPRPSGTSNRFSEAPSSTPPAEPRWPRATPARPATILPHRSPHALPPLPACPGRHNSALSLQLRSWTSE
mmetsp:Transcript_8712/g.20491  ORF Transcript_8712/g.20491 Transcript_8712/m.20491 type:complete len:225 (-) Transcript_8712:284-958(-)